MYFHYLEPAKGLDGLWLAVEINECIELWVK